MTGYWLTWMKLWCWAVVAFGVLMATGAAPTIDGPVVGLLTLMGGASPEMTQPLRFALALIGAVSIGWGLSLLAVVRVAGDLGDRARPLWSGISAAVAVWYVIDSSLSVATGFALNAVSNTVLLVGYFVPVWRSGVLGATPAGARR